MREQLILLGIVSGEKYKHQKARDPNFVNLVSEMFSEYYARAPDTLSEAIYCFYHEVKPALCYCGNPNTYVNFYEGYRHHCSSRCATLDPHSQEKLKSTNLHRRGVENPSQSPEVRNKFKQTMRDKYGVDNPMQLTETREKAKSTTRNRYGVDHAMKAIKFQDKRKATSTERYGADHPMKSEGPLAKARATNKDRRGVEYPTQSLDVVKKSRETNLDRYGFENPMQNPDVKNKTRNTWLRNHGVQHPSQRLYSEKTRQILSDRNLFEEFIKSRSLNSAAIELNIDRSTVGDYCGKHGVVISGSSYENEIGAFLTDMNLDHVMHSRSIIGPYELDLFSEENRLAIEFNGLYWHSHERLKDRQYHLKKLLKCNELGIRLLSINEDEWIERSDCIKNKIKNICGLTDRGPAARKLSVTKIHNKIANEFVEKYHLQGASSGIVASFGAFDGTNLVGAMQYSKQRGTGDIELVRFCSDEKSHAGLFSKMFCFSTKIEGYEYVVSFADRRYSEGRVYEVNNFTETKIIPPDYRYIKGLKTFHKSLFTKNRIAAKFNLDMAEITETEAMKILGYQRIYDCGKIRYEWILPQV
jgi:hypothetical protein